MVELAAGSFDRGLGTAASQAQFLGSGGFSAYGANQVVNLGGASAKVTWGTGGFVPSYGMLMLGSPYSNAMIDFQNPIDFGNNRGSVWVQGTAAVDARLSGTLSSSGSGGLTENGPGTLELTAANTYTGQTVVSGVLRLSNSDALPGGTGAAGGTSNLLLGGGVVELNAGNFDRGLGTAASQVQLGSGGGFSAYGTNRVVNLGGASAQVTWGSGGFVADGYSLNLSSPDANALVDFQNPIVLVSSYYAYQTISVADGAAAVDARLSGVLSGSAGTGQKRRRDPGTDRGQHLHRSHVRRTGQTDRQRLACQPGDRPERRHLERHGQPDERDRQPRWAIGPGRSAGRHERERQPEPGVGSGDGL